MIHTKPPQEIDLILAITDITGFAHAAKLKSNLETFELLTELYGLTGEIVESSGGRAVKFMGDAALITFPSDNPQQAVFALRTLQAQAENLLGRLGANCRMYVRLHVGRVACGLLGTETTKQYDILGRSLNELFLMPDTGFVISPELQQRLDDLN